jgi:DNA primase
VGEGEADAVSLTELGFDAVGIPGTSAKTNDDYARRIAHAGYDRVRVWLDADAVGRKCMRTLAAKVGAHGVPAFVIDQAPDRTDGYDIGDVLADFGAEGAGRIVAKSPLSPMAPAGR